MSPAAKAQRRTAALRTGEHAATPTRRTLPACRKATCPGQCFPCSLRSDAASRGLALEVCPVALVADSARRDAYLKALADNDRSAIRPLVASKLGLLDQLAEKELDKLADEGLVSEQELFGGDGEALVRKVENPRAKPLFAVLGLLGVDAREQLATPKAASEAKKDEAIGSAASLLDRLISFRAGGQTETPEIDE